MPGKTTRPAEVMVCEPNRAFRIRRIANKAPCAAMENNNAGRLRRWLVSRVCTGLPPREKECFSEANNRIAGRIEKKLFRAAILNASEPSSPDFCAASTVFVKENPG